MAEVIRENEDNGLSKGYYSNTTMAFFLRLFDLCEEKRQLCAGTGTCRQNMDVNNKIIMGKVYPEVLVEYFKKNESSDRGETTKENNQEVRACIIKVNNDTKNEIKALDEILEYLDNLFIEPSLCIQLKEKICLLKECYNQDNDCILWSNNDINRFLNQYYDVLYYFICNNSLLEVEGIQLVIRKLLNLGIVWDTGSVYAKMVSPVVLSALQLIYKRLDEYILTGFNEDEVIILQRVYKEIFLSKVHQIFRFYVSGLEDSCLYHAALPMYDISSQSEELCIPVRKLSSYNSYQGIRELRLGEKIIYEIKQMDWSNEKKCVITLLGDISEKPFIELADYVEEKKKKIASVEIFYKVYTNKSKYCEAIVTGKSFWCEFFRYNEELFSSPQNLKNIIENSNIVFFLDNCQLYHNEIKDIDDLIKFKQRYSMDSYEKYFCSLKTNNLVLNCKYIDLYQVLTTFSIEKRLGYIKKRAREEIISYIKGYMQSVKNKTVYIYISDLSAFNKLGCAQENMVRIEKYNQKELGIIRFTSCAWEILNVKDEENSKKILVFNLWQFVKYCAINEKEYYSSLFIKEDGQKNNLSQILIGLDYSQWQDKFVVYTSHDKWIDSTNVNKFISVIIPKILDDAQEDMYCKCIKDALVSILYGTAKSLEDLLFVHILKHKSKLVGKMVCSEENIDLSNYQKDNCKYSYKKLFWDAMEKLDEAQLGVVEEYNLLSNVKTNHLYIDAVNADDVLNHFFNNIYEACEGLGYRDSLLYENIISEI